MATASTDAAPIPAAWRSDDGVTWEEAAYELPAAGGGVVEALTRVVPTDTGFAALGSPWFGIATSDDGTTWTYESLGDGACPAAIAARDELLVAVGSIGPCGMGGGPGTPAIWIRGADGWALLDAPAAAGWFTGVVATPDGFSAWGTVTASADGWICEIGCRPDPSLEPYAGAPWSSADGRTWRRASDPTPFAGATIGAIVATDAQTTALGSIWSADGASGQVALWTSSTGDDWSRVESELPFGDVDPAAGPGIGAGGDVLAVWARHLGPVATVTVWTSADLSEWKATDIVADLRGASRLGDGLIAYGTVPMSAAGGGTECSKDEVLAGTCRNVAAAWVYLSAP